ncbi:MAG: hypothetical protein ABSF90_27585 [Syntrophobacteraceae bacterium]|jgi:hypothetical protein
MQAYDDALIKEYFGKVKSLGVRPLSGTSVQEEVENIVKTAVEHFSIVQTGTELGNLRRFMDLLAFAAETTPSSQPEMHATLGYAAQLVDQIIHTKRKTSDFCPQPSQTPAMRL